MCVGLLAMWPTASAAAASSIAVPVTADNKSYSALQLVDPVSGGAQPFARTGAAPHRTTPSWSRDATKIAFWEDSPPGPYYPVGLVIKPLGGTIEEASTQVQVVFMDALELEGLLALVEARQDAAPANTFPFDAAVDEPEPPPILLAVSDNGPQMTSNSKREVMAMCAIAQHFGRPGTADRPGVDRVAVRPRQAEWPHLDHIKDPEVLRAELAVVRRQYNTVRLHAGIG